MARYRVGNAELSGFEYSASKQGAFNFWLFAIGAGLTFFYMPLIVPEAWPKYLRFGLMLSGSCGIGVLLGSFQYFVLDSAFKLVVGLAATGVVYWLWTVV